MLYRNRETGIVITYNELGHYCNCYIPINPTQEYIDPLGFDLVLETPPPATSPTEIAEVSGAQFTGSQWQTTWSVRPMTQAELDAKATADAAAEEMILAAPCDAFKARVALSSIGQLAAVNAVVAALPADNLARIWWESFQPVHYNAPSLVAICNQLGLDRRALFLAASNVDTSAI